MATCKNLSARERLGRSAALTFYFATPTISQKQMELGSWNLVCLQAFTSTRVLRKKFVSQRASGLPIFILGPAPYLRSQWSQDVEIQHTGRHLKVLWLHIKICPLGAPGKINSHHFLFWDPLYISETNLLFYQQNKTYINHI